MSESGTNGVNEHDPKVLKDLEKEFERMQAERKLYEDGVEYEPGKPDNSD